MINKDIEQYNENNRNNNRNNKNGNRNDRNRNDRNRNDRNNKNGNLNIKRNIDETNSSFIKRKWFVNIVRSETEKEYNRAVMLSNVWINMILLKCRYPENIENEIFQILEKQNKSKIMNINS